MSEYETDRITIIVCDEITRIDAVEHVSAAMNNWEKGKKWFGWSGIDVAIDDAGNWIVHRDRRGRWSDGHCRKCGDKVGGD